MTFVFDRYELDPSQRELRFEGRAKSLQPQVFDLLVYLIRHRDRVVNKAELLEHLWPDSVVTESSIQRAISLARSALDSRGAELIQTFPRKGYRFVGEVREQGAKAASDMLRPKYTKSGDVHIAYATLGSGDLDMVIVNGWIMPMRGMLEYPKLRKVMTALSEKGRVILFDKRGTGLSDRVKELPSHEQRMDDFRVVLDACESKQAVLIGISEGGALAMLFAAARPERVRGLVLAGAFARMTRSTMYPYGYTDEEVDKIRSYIRGGWGKGASLRAICPSEATDATFLEWLAFSEQQGASPGGALDLLEMNIRIDLRALLPSVRVPTVVLQAAGDKMIHPGSGPFLARHIPNARYVEVEGDDHLFFFWQYDHLLDAVDWVATRPMDEPREDRFLSTVLVARPNEVVPAEAWRERVERFRGEPVPGELRAHFDGPVRALQCSQLLATEQHIACGVHTGEVVKRGTRVAGQAFEVAERLAARADEGRVYTSRVVVDLVPGTDVRFEPTGTAIEAGERQFEVYSVLQES